MRQSARWLRSRFVDRALILGYHRIADVEWDPFALCVSPEYFAEQLQFLRQHAAPLSLQEMVQGLRQKKLPKRAVVVTFDDGYLDTLVHAKPLLERYQIPATVFVTTGNMGRAFWWDELVRLLAVPTEVPESLSITIAGKPYTWRLYEKARQRTGQIDPEAHRKLVGSLFRLMLPLDPPIREDLLCQLRVWSGVQFEELPVSRGMTPAELIEMAASDMIEIGAHTVTHPLLAAMPLAAQQTEIQQSKAYLEKLLARPVRGFSYPNGSVGRDTVASTRAAGFVYACASHTDVAWYGSNRFCLPRLWAPNEPVTKFAPWLHRWL